jgi:hypothetical protein
LTGWNVTRKPIQFSTIGRESEVAPWVGCPGGYVCYRSARMADFEADRVAASISTVALR